MKSEAARQDVRPCACALASARAHRLPSTRRDAQKRPPLRVCANAQGFGGDALRFPSAAAAPPLPDPSDSQDREGGEILTRIFKRKKKKKRFNFQCRRRTKERKETPEVSQETTKRRGNKVSKLRRPEGGDDGNLVRASSLPPYGGSSSSNPPVERADGCCGVSRLSAAWTEIILHRWTAAHFGEGEAVRWSPRSPICLLSLSTSREEERGRERKGRVGVLRPGGAAWIPAGTWRD